MKLGSLSLAKKLLLGFSIVLILFMGVGVLTNFGIGNIVTQAVQVIEANSLSGFLAECEVDHLAHMGDVQQFLSANEPNSLDVESNPRECQLGKWLYGRERSESENLIPGLAPLLAQMEAAHLRLHQSITDIKDTFKPADLLLPAKLVEGEVGMLKWTAAVNEALAKEKPSLGVPINSAESHFGKWLAAEKSKAAYEQSATAFKQKWDELIQKHGELYATAEQIQDDMAGFEQLKANRKVRQTVKTEWSQISETLFGEIGKVRSDIIEPAKQKAVGANDTAAIIFWAQVDVTLENAFIKPLLNTQLNVAQTSGEDSIMLPQIFESNRQAINAGLKQWGDFIENNQALAAVTKSLEKLTGQWIVGGLKYAQAAVDENSAQSLIDDAHYIFEEETLAKMNEALFVLNELKGLAEDALKSRRASNDIYIQKAVPAIVETRQAIADSISHIHTQMTTAEAMLGTAREVRTLSMALGTAAALVGILLAVFISSRIVTVLRRISGDLNVGAGQVSSGSGEVAASSQELAEGTARQASSLEEASASLEQMSAMTHRNAEHADAAYRLVDETKSITRAANKSMDKLEGSMSELSQASQETSKIIKTIDEIAFQTNLLALNAAVEAARAGEAGAGFAVVADEVRNLAIRSAAAASDTSDLIANTVKKIDTGAELMKATNQDFDRVEESVHKVSDLISDISEASREQSQGIDQVNSAVSELDREVQQNAANAEQSAAAAQEMSSQSEVMKFTAGQLTEMVGGHVENHRRAGVWGRLKNLKALFRMPKWNKRKSEKKRAADPQQGQSPAGVDSMLDDF